MKNSIQLLSIISIFLCVISCKQEDVLPTDNSIKDGSGNVYTEVKIGEQIWLKEDLATEKYIDGTFIHSSLYDNKGTSGYYYSYLIDFNSICPEGYKVPTKSDIEKLIVYFGGDKLDESQILDAYVNTWNGNPNGNGDGIINQGSGLYWTSTNGPTGYYHFYFRTINAGLSVQTYGSKSSFHIKCIKR